MDVKYSRVKEDGAWVAELKQSLKLKQQELLAEEAEGGAEVGQLQVLTLRQVLAAAPMAVGRGAVGGAEMGHLQVSTLRRLLVAAPVAEGQRQGEEVAQVMAEGECRQVRHHLCINI